MAGADGTAAILRVIGSALAARHVGFRRLEDGGAALHCDSEVDLAAGTAAGGIRLRRTEVRRLFAAIEGATQLDVADAAADPRTAELARLCLRPIGSRGLLSVPVAGALPAAGATPPLGAPWVEDAGAGVAEAGAFARTAAALLARGTLPVPSGAPGAPAQAPAPRPSHPAAPAARRCWRACASGRPTRGTRPSCSPALACWRWCGPATRRSRPRARPMAAACSCASAPSWPPPRRRRCRLRAGAGRAGAVRRRLRRRW